MSEAMAIAPSDHANIQIRHGAQSDLPLVFSSWLRSYWMTSTFARRLSKTVYFDWHHKVIERILARGAKLLVASPQDDETSILGWAVTETAGDLTIAHFCYVKAPFRRMGLARRLLLASGIDLDNLTAPITISHLADDIAPRPPNDRTITNPARIGGHKLRRVWYLDRWPQITYCPYLV